MWKGSMYADTAESMKKWNHFWPLREGTGFEEKLEFKIFQGNRAEQCLATVRSKCLQDKTVNPQSWTDAVLTSVGIEIHILGAPGHDPSSNFRSAHQSLGISVDPVSGHQEPSGHAPWQDSPSYKISSPRLSLTQADSHPPRLDLAGAGHLLPAKWTLMTRNLKLALNTEESSLSGMRLLAQLWFL